jgi:signal transduction histidine kinase
VRQYRWIEKASEAEREERRQFLRTALGGIGNDLVERVRKPLAAIRPEWSLPRGTDRPALFAARFRQWRQEGGDASLLAGIAMGWIEQGRARYLRMGAADESFGDSDWPEALLVYRKDLERRANQEGDPPPLAPEGSAWAQNGFMLLLVFPVIESDQSPPSPAAGRMLRPPPGRPGAADLRGWCFLEISPAFLQNLFPGLVLKYFGETGADSYLVALRSDHPPRIVCQSVPSGLHWRETDTVDEEVPLFWPPGPGRVSRPRGPAEPKKVPARPPPPDGGRGRFFADPPGWRLTARHRTGSLDDEVSRNRRQSLLFSSGVLLLLLGSGVLLVVSTHRARRLAQQQMEFVAGVSHELRTPLTVINTTSYNLAQGKVSDERRVQQYGETIQKEVRRLTTQVEQMLSFAGIESGRKLYDASPVDVADVIAKSLAGYANVLAAEGWHVEKQIEEGLPPVIADGHVVESALKNLIENALKYAGTGRWLAVTAQGASGRGRREVRITVADRGPGIKAEDLPHIFEPFYRGRNASSGPVAAGVGLGLSLVERHLRAMGGRVTVEPTAGHGAAFTLHLPAAKSE